jgi:hypothetical protein
VNDFCQIFEPLWHQQLLSDGHNPRHRNAKLSLSENMTIQIAFHQPHYRNFKAFDLEKVCVDWLPAFSVGIGLITKPKRNMKNKLMPLMDKILTRKRSIIETMIDLLKNISQIEHSRHRSPVNCMVNIVCGLIAYCHQPKKPSLNINEVCLPAASTELRLKRLKQPRLFKNEGYRKTGDLK